MCVFVSVTASIDALEKRFRAEANKNNTFKPVYHTSAYTQPQLPIITGDAPKEIQFFRWGLIPAWVKDEESAAKIWVNTVNAKAETLTEKPSFREPAKNKRCLVPVDGFFEYMEQGKKKYPFYIRLRNRQPFALAGIYDHHTNRTTGEIESTFSIITTVANPLLEKIHNRKKRMPVILPPENETAWIDKTGDIANLQRLLVPFNENELEAYSVSRRISEKGINTNTEESIHKFNYEELQDRLTLF